MAIPSPITAPDAWDTLTLGGLPFDGEFEFETFVSLTCQNCPDVVQALNLISTINPNITHTAIDGALGRILERAESIVVDALGFTFFDDGVAWDDIDPTTKRIRSEPSRYLRLPPYRVGSITAIAVLSGTTITTTTVDAAAYEETEEHFYLYRPDGWGGVRYAVTAQFGYGPAPASIVELILELAVNIWRQRDQGLFQAQLGQRKPQLVVLMIGGNIPGATRVLSVAIYDHVEANEYADAHRLAAGMVGGIATRGGDARRERHRIHASHLCDSPCPNSEGAGHGRPWRERGGRRRARVGGLGLSLGGAARAALARGGRQRRLAAGCRRGRFHHGGHPARGPRPP